MNYDENWPKISIITPSYNQGEYIEDTILSVLSQNYPNLEYIVMDGGSTDNTSSILDKYRSKITYIESRKDDGQADAIARGFAIATGEIFAWINSDDRYLPNAFFRVAKIFKKYPKTIFFHGDVNMIDHFGNFMYRNYTAIPNYFIISNYGYHRLPQQGCFWTKKAYEKVGGIDKNLNFCMDRDLFLRLIRTGPTRRIAGPPVADFRSHAKAKSSCLLDIAEKENNYLINKYGNPRFKSNILFLKFCWHIWSLPNYLRSTFNNRIYKKD